jgi:ABC-type amino acid transport substrate-binding protein
MAGIYVTNERIENVKVSDSYFRGPLVMVVPSNRAHKFLSRQKIAGIEDLKIAVFYDQVFLNLVSETFPQAQMKVVSNLQEMASFNGFDAVIWTLTQGSILASIKPGLSVVVPTDLGPPFLFAYPMPPNSNELREYVNYWLDLKEDDGFTKRMNDYWILGKPSVDPSPRWSVIRNVLHWVD